MTKAAPTKQNPWVRIWDATRALAIRTRDMASWQNARLSAVENRLAELDGGADADAARAAALADANARRVSAGGDKLAFRIGNNATIEWVGPALPGGSE